MYEQTKARKRVRRVFAMCIMAMVTASSSSFLHGCKRGPTEPEIKNPRDYQWTIDTLPGWMQCIWGSSPMDVYMGGFGPLYHFDGNQWTMVPFSTVYDFGDIDCIWGSGRDVFTVGAKWDTGKDSSIIMHYDGSRWVDQNVTNGRSLFTVWGSSAKDVWAGGRAGTLFHFDGTVWSKVPIDARLDVHSITGRSSNDIFLLGDLVNDAINGYLNYDALYHYDGIGWQILDSMSVAASQFGTSFGEVKLAYVGNTLYSVGYGIFSLRSDGWHLDKHTDYAIQWLHSPTTSTAYAVGQESLIYYYDGQGWERLMNVIDSGHWLTGVWSTNNETFIIGNSGLDASHTIVLHGR
jgi:hypothetical protein